jgi:ATP-binding protein involved in chromosome partitioning
LITKEAIEQALRNVPDVQGGDIVTQNRVERIDINEGNVILTLQLPIDDAGVKQGIEDASRRALKALDGVREVMIMTKGAAPAQAGGSEPGPTPGAGQGSPFDAQAPIEGVKHIVAVSSAKGGVGKSTVCVNLALALAARGMRVGLVDVDVYGPSTHVLLGTTDRPTAGRDKEIAPVEKHGLKLMSLGFLSDPGMPVIWRGPIVTGVVRKFLQDVEWGELDFLLVDMPPGTGDAQLTLVQTVPLTGAVIVTTPSELALVDAEKGLEMYRTVKSPVLGIVENMSYFVCPHCNERTEIFSHGGTREISKRLDTPFLGEIPLDPVVRSSGDEGDPVVRRSPDSPAARAFFEIADRVREACGA